MNWILTLGVLGLDALKRKVCESLRKRGLALEIKKMGLQIFQIAKKPDNKYLNNKLLKKQNKILSGTSSSAQQNKS